ncbi:hypothetical protein T458_12220 [Brevibacillus panacihumi W25]|uniref:Uncharacterized protein n=1 Tax=Brevibacillus panacihumi W25 TaxID=1408254 RepID=V6M8G2_9BACL|nr:hypothetical protein [Brevibacillus panacihumi]EST54542.1 hypothetical protein T458_12220 [Brevibacillus panacihumi W25]
MRIVGIVYDLIINKKFRNLQSIGSTVGKKAEKKVKQVTNDAEE